MMPPTPVARAASSLRFSTCRSCIRYARSMINLTTSASNGLAKKSCAPSATARRALALSFWPVTTITFVSGASSRIFSSVRNPSLTLPVSGGSPRSSVTTAGSARRSCAMASSKSDATATSYPSKAHFICSCSAGSSSTTSRERRSSVMPRLPVAGLPPPRAVSPALASRRWARCAPRSRRQAAARTAGTQKRQFPCRCLWSSGTA